MIDITIQTINQITNCFIHSSLKMICKMFYCYIFWKCWLISRRRCTAIVYDCHFQNQALLILHSTTRLFDMFEKIIQISDEIFKLTPSHDEGHWMVTGTCLTVPLPKASLFLWAENNLSSFFSSSLRLLQYLFKRNRRC